MADISAQLIDQVMAARSDGNALSIQGRNSKSFYGRETTGTPLALSDHAGVVSYQPEELVLTARAGTSIATIEATLAEAGQQLAFDPPRFDGGASLGGSLACNFSGPSRPWSGSMRDAVLGIRLINGNGEQLRFGGRVMKNVAGYDVSRLQAGALGCLGVITEISLKVLPIPSASSTVRVQVPRAGDAIKLMNRFSATPIPLSGAYWFEGGLYLRLEGAARAVESCTMQLQSEYSEINVLDPGKTTWSALRDQQLPFFDGPETLWRFSLGSSHPHFLDDSPWLIDWGGAQRWLRGDFDRSALEAQLGDLQSEVSAFRSVDRAQEVFQQPCSTAKTLHLRLKKAFDPAGIFNPGRLHSWL